MSKKRSSIDLIAGKYKPYFISKLQDGEVFIDTKGEQGLWMGVYNEETDDVDHVHVATVGGSGGDVQIIDNLDSTDPAAALSANMGRYLKEYINTNTQPLLTDTDGSYGQRVAEIEGVIGDLNTFLENF